MSKFNVKINCVFVHWTKKLTLPVIPLGISYAQLGLDRWCHFDTALYLLSILSENKAKDPQGYD